MSNIAELTDIIGYESALKLAYSCPVYGGRRVLYVPIRIKNATHLAEIIGNDKLKKIHDRLAGNQITLGDPDIFSRRVQALKMLRDPVHSITKIARETGVSRNFLYRHWN